MAGPLSRRPSARTLLRASLVVLFLLAVVPMRFTRWTTGFADVAVTVSAPVSNAVRWIADPLTRPFRRTADPALAEQYKRELEAARQRSLDLELKVRELERLVYELQRGIDLTPELGVRQVAAPVIGRFSESSSAALQVRAGTGRGVVENSVAVVEGLQLLGRVERVTSAWCVVRPITDNAAGGIMALVMTSESLDSGIQCRLEPAGGGLLKGPAAWQPEFEGEEPVEIVVGMTVRLRDETWPRSAQMLIVGEVVEVAPAPDEPTRTVITVAPTVPLQRVSEVVLRVPIDPEVETVGSGREGGTP
ncbi:MAG: rod shape-determining protein MreC [Phycisphaerales bacterium JB060]